MLTTEFKQKIEQLGYTHKELPTGNGGRITQIAIYDEGEIIGRVSIIIQYRMTTMSSKFGKSHGSLFNLMADYVKTPIKERS